MPTPAITNRTIFLHAIPANKSTQGIVIRKTHKNRGFLVLSPSGELSSAEVGVGSVMAVDLFWLHRELSTAALSQLSKTGVITRAEVKWLRETSKARDLEARKRYIERDFVSAARAMRRFGTSKANAEEMLRSAFAES